ncbi:hypothetical protein PO909_000497, partial [Leuciscus waleckii]
STRKRQHLEFVQRRFLDINPERGSKTKKGQVTSKKTGQVVQNKTTTVSLQVSSLLRKLADFEWDFVCTFMDFKTETAIHCHYKAWKSQDIY